MRNACVQPSDTIIPRGTQASSEQDRLFATKESQRDP